MNCLLIAATAKEIEPFIQYYRKSDNKPDIDIIITGIGLTAATYALTKQIALKRPRLVIQAGIAGCFDKNISLGSVVVVKQDALADQGVIENKQLKTIFDPGLLKLNEVPFSKGKLINPHMELMRKTKLKKVNAVSVNQVTTSIQLEWFYKNKFHPVVESMEGAALHYVSLKEKIPFLQIRGISNYIGDRDKKKWIIKDAIISLNETIINLLNQLRTSNIKL